MISTKGRYALRLMMDLAAQPADSPIKLKDVAERQNISVKYLEQIIAVLNKAGIVRSIRGPQGGYLLNRSPKEYTVGTILRLTEGDLAPVNCVSHASPECQRESMCSTVIVWKKLYDAINGVIDSFTLQDLLDMEAEHALSGEDTSAFRCQ